MAANTERSHISECWHPQIATRIHPGEWVNMALLTKSLHLDACCCNYGGGRQKVYQQIKSNQTIYFNKSITCTFELSGREEKSYATVTRHNNL